MRYRLTFITGVAVGYVLGAQAGRERYEQLRKGAQRVAQNPAVRNTAESAAQCGRQTASRALGAVRSLRERREQARQDPFHEDEWGTSNT